MATPSLRASSAPIELPVHTELNSSSTLGTLFRKYWSEILIVSAALINIAVALSVTYFPYTDINNHLARYALIHDALFSGASPEHVLVRWLPTAYIAIDLVGAALLHVFAAETVAKILVVAYLTSLPLGTYLFARAVAPQQRAFALVGTLLSFNWYFLLGFVNYGLGIAFALMVMSWWWPRRTLMSAGQLAIFGAGTAGLYMVHMSAAALVLVAAGLEYALFLYNGLRTRPSSFRQLILDSRAAPVIVATLSLVALLVVMKLTTPAGGQDVDALYLRPLKKFSYLLAPFYSFSALQAWIMAGGYLLCLGLFFWLGRPDALLQRKTVVPTMVILGCFLICIPVLGLFDGSAYYSFSTPRVAGLFTVCLTALGYWLWKTRTNLGDNTLAVMSPTLVIIYFLFPVALFGAYYVDVRFLLPAYMLVFFIPVRDNHRNTIRYTAHALWIATVLHAAVTLYYSRDINKNLHDFRQVLTQIPKGKTVLTLVADHDQYGRIAPYRHFTLWRVTDHVGWASGLFSGDVSGEQLGHFLVTTQLYYPNENWGTKILLPAPDWDRVSADYQYLIQAGDDPRVEAILSKYAKPIYRRGEIALYEVRYHAVASKTSRNNRERTRLSVIK